MTIFDPETPDIYKVKVKCPFVIANTVRFDRISNNAMEPTQITEISDEFVTVVRSLYADCKISTSDYDPEEVKGGDIPDADLFGYINLSIREPFPNVPPSPEEDEELYVDYPCISKRVYVGQSDNIVDTRLFIPPNQALYAWCNSEYRFSVLASGEKWVSIENVEEDPAPTPN